MKPLLSAALASASLIATAAQAASTYNFVVAPILGATGQPLVDDRGYTDGRTFYLTIGANQIPDIVSTYPGFKYPNYRVVSYSYSNPGSTALTTLPPIVGRNIVFHDYINQGGLFLTQDGNPPSSGSTSFALFGDDASEVLYDDAAYKAALTTNPSAQPVFKLGVFQLSTYPRNGSATQPIQNYTVTISQAAAVPEPASWAMMIGGFGLIGGTMRRRRGTLAAA